MKATFIGDPSQPDEKVPDTLQHLGLTFEKGKATEVPKELEAKFAGNSHFKVSRKEAEVKSPPPTENTETVAALTTRVASVTDVEALKAELAKETRSTGKAALEARIAELEKPAE